MIDPTRLAAIKALRPTPGRWREVPMSRVNSHIRSGMTDIANFWAKGVESPSGFDGFPPKSEQVDNIKLFIESADPEYGLQALAAEVERLQEREKPVKVTETLPWVGGMSSIHEGCHVFSYAGLRPSYCPNCGRKLEWS